jgi:hypothetical protein
LQFKKGNNINHFVRQKGENKPKKVGLTELVRNHIIEKLNQAKAAGVTTIQLKSGDIHRSLQLDNRMPNVCNAMVSLGVYRFEIVRDTPSGLSSTKLVRYFL